MAAMRTRSTSSPGSVSRRDGNAPSDSASYFGGAPVAGRYSYLRHYAGIVEEVAGVANATVRLHRGGCHKLYHGLSKTLSMTETTRFT